jgi:hypothetical protein
MCAETLVGVLRGRCVLIALQQDLRCDTGEFWPRRRIEEIAGARNREVELELFARQLLQD